MKGGLSMDQEVKVVLWFFLVCIVIMVVENC